jgi:membrane-bound lytic murein transglycosylase D
MTAQTVITVLMLAICGAFGCVPAMVPSPSIEANVAHELPEQAVSENPAPFPHETSGPPVLDSMPQALVEHQDIIEETLYTPVPATSIKTATRTPGKPANTDDTPKKALVISPDDAAALQKTPGPRADNRLLDLVEKDIEKAVEKPRERRRLEFSKEVSSHPKVRYFINYFSKRGKPYFEKILARSGKYMPMIATVLNDEGLPEELAYLALIESAFLTSATSPQGAVGLWQFIPSTARLYGLKIDKWVDERRDPEKSTRAAAAYLKDLHGYFGRWNLTTAAYNAGPGAIGKAMQQSGAKDFWTLSRKAQLSDETRNFVPKFVAVAIIATNPEKYGFANLQYESPVEYEEVEIRRSLRVGTLAEMAEADVSTIRELNPALLGNTTPPRNESFLVKLPVGKSLVFAKAYEASNDNTLQTSQSITHEVKQGDTLISIARRYGQEVSALMMLNGLTSARLQIGQKLQILLQSLSGRLK